MRRVPSDSRQLCRLFGDSESLVVSRPPEPQLELQVLRPKLLPSTLELGADGAADPPGETRTRRRVSATDQPPTSASLLATGPIVGGLGGRGPGPGPWQAGDATGTGTGGSAPCAVQSLAPHGPALSSTPWPSKSDLTRPGVRTELPMVPACAPALPVWACTLQRKNRVGSGGLRPWGFDCAN